MQVTLEEIYYNERKKIVFNPETLDIFLVDRNELISTNDVFIEKIKNTNEKEKSIDKLMINVTNLCNMKCIYCYSKYENDEDISEKVLDKIAENFFQKNSIAVSKVVFFGGEPLLAFEKIKYFVNKIKLTLMEKEKLFPSFSVITNGSIMEENIASFFKENNFQVLVSIDGPENVHNYQRKMKDGTNSYYKISQTLKILKSYDIPVSFESTLTKRSIKLNFDENAIRKNIQENFGIKNGVVVDVMSEDDTLKPPTCVSLEDKFATALKMMDFDNEFFYLTLNIMLKRHRSYPCQLVSGIDNVKIGNILDDSLDNIMTNSFFDMFSEKLNNDKCNNCFAKKLCQYCPARAYIETKNWLPGINFCNNFKDSVRRVIVELVRMRTDKEKFSQFQLELKKYLKNNRRRFSHAFN